MSSNSGELKLRLTYILSDYAMANAAWCIFNIVRYNTLPFNYTAMSLASYYSMPIVLLGQIIFPIMMVALFAVSGYYNNVYFKSRVDELINSFGISLIGSVIIFFVALYNDSIDDRLRNYELITILWLLISVMVTVPRLVVTRRVIKRIRSRKIYFDTIIVGTSKNARRLAAQLEHKYPQMGFNIVGFASDAPSGAPDSTDSLPVYTLGQLRELIPAKGVKSVIIVNDHSEVKDIISIVNSLFPIGCAIYVTPDTMNMITARPRTRMVSGEVLIDVTKSEIPQSTLNIKRISDIVVSALCMVLLMPVYLVIALWVKCTSRGPVIYSQERVGLKKKIFRIYKFRTMCVDSEKDGPALSSENDPRITKVGHILRKYRLDELPQFWNVLKGDMSIVGPRPEREFYLRQIIERAPYFSLLQQVRPGITSWGMVKYGYATSVDQMIERARYDLMYVDNVSLILDLKILFYTIETVITGRGV